ncbi:unnamed protein product, partial [Prorocentrum cordatum]
GAATMLARRISLPAGFDQGLALDRRLPTSFDQDGDHSPFSSAQARRRTTAAEAAAGLPQPGCRPHVAMPAFWEPRDDPAS